MWESLNERQHTYMQLIFEQDQAQELAERQRAARDQRSRPADAWRWISYADTLYGHTALKQAIKDTDMVDPGTGSTFEALRTRGLILMKYERAGPHPRADVNVLIRLTTKGRRIVRQALAVKTQVKLPVGTLREWHWRALCRAYVCGDLGMTYDVDTDDGFGYVSWKTYLRLRDYKSHGEEKPLIAEKRFNEPHTERVAGYAFERDYTTRICMTEFGKRYYRENWQRYREMYPEVDAPEPL